MNKKVFLVALLVLVGLVGILDRREIASSLVNLTNQTYGTLPAKQGGGLVLVETHTASSSTEVDFTTCITSTYDDYIVKLFNVLPATNATVLDMQVSTNGGSSYDTGTNYTWGGLWSGSSSASDGFDFGNSSSNGTQIDVTGTTVTVVNTANPGGVSGTLELFNPGGGAFKRMSIDVNIPFSGSSNYYHFNAHGGYLSTTAYNAFRFLMSSGNIASGTLRCYGVQH